MRRGVPCGRRVRGAIGQRGGGAWRTAIAGERAAGGAPSRARHTPQAI